MLSKSQVSFVRLLHHKKNRKEHQLFIVEGIKSVSEFINSGYLVNNVYATGNVMPKLVNLSQKVKVTEITPTDINKMSTLATPQQVLAVVQIPVSKTISSGDFKGSYTLALDGLQDPGNLGTILRTADWFGIKQIICSEDCVEVYNPKVVQASMGSLSRMNVHYCSLSALLQKIRVPVYAATLNGKLITETVFGNEGVIVFGNEGNGIRPELINLISNRVTIPGSGRAESLNVAVSVALLCYEVHRNILK